LAAAIAIHSHKMKFIGKMALFARSFLDLSLSLAHSLGGAALNFNPFRFVQKISSRLDLCVVKRGKFPAAALTLSHSLSLGLLAHSQRAAPAFHLPG
jgi:hypothetical protein